MLKDHGVRTKFQRLEKRGCKSSNGWKFSACLAAVLLAGTADAQLPAFPGAEGYGAWARGGRGGDVYHVTTLAASGPGSFAYGAQNAPPQGRTILFDVSGHIRLPSGSGGGLTIDRDRITVAGQSAPGDGICFWNNTMNIAASDLVFRHVRWRFGKQAGGGDCVDIGSSATNVIFDHCDVMFSTDENFSSFGGIPENMTFQWSCNAWGLQSHSCGGLWEVKHTTTHHTLWAQNHTRNPKAIRPRALDWANNVTFGWDLGFNMAGADAAGTYRINMRGCYFIHGASTTEAIYGGGTASDSSIPFYLHMSDCALDGNNNGVLDVSRSNYSMVSAGAYNQAATPFPQTVAADPAAPGDPVVGVPVSMDNRLTAYKKVISHVGPLRMDVDPGRPLRDEVTALLVQDVVGLHRRIISDPDSLGLSGGSFATLNSVPAPRDSDRDGMPDYWEAAVGFNPAADDHNTVFPGSGGFITGLTFFPTNSPAGYTYLDEYLHFLAIPHGTVKRNLTGAPTFLDIDLRKFTSGFTNSPVFTLTNSVNGAAAMLPDGHSARFTPALDFFGRARFDFTVTDSAGSAWSQTLGILVSASGVPRNLVWAGDGAGNDWDTATANWLDGTNRTAFGVDDTLLFDDRGSSTPAVDLIAPLAPGSVVVNAEKDYTFSGTGSLYGAMSLEKFGDGLLVIGVSNGFSGGTLISGGEIRLQNDIANAHGLGKGPITLANGTLSMYDNIGTYNSATYNLVVPGGAVGSLNADGRVSLYGTLSGSGVLNLKAPFVRTTLYGDWSDFDGRLNVSNSTLQTASAFGFPAASVFLGPGAAVEFAGGVAATGTVLAIGELAGAASSTLRGGDTAGRVLTCEVGRLNSDAAFDGAVMERTDSSITAIRKVGSGAWTLTGANHTYRGATTVSNGTLVINGALGPSAVTVESGARLAGAGVVAGGARANAGGELAPGNGVTPVGTMTVSNGLNLASPSMYFDLSGSPAGFNDRIQMAGGLLTMTGTQSYFFNLLDNGIGAGVYDLISGGTNTTAAGVGFTHNLPAGTRQGFALQRPASGNGQCYVRLSVSGNAASLVWSGSADGTWAANAATNWLNAGAGDRFFNLDRVVFNDAAPNRTASLMDAVQPASIVVSNDIAFAIAGTGTIVGAASLVKAGNGTLTIVSSNAYSGGAFLNGGTIALANDTANAWGLGTGPITFGGGTLAMHSDNGSYNGATYHLAVPSGQTGWFLADDRCDLYGTLSGGGTLNVRVTFVRTTLYGDWSAFSGRINIVSDAGGGDLRIGSSYAWPGLPRASLHLVDHVNFYYAGLLSGGGGTTVDIGELSGTTESLLWGGETGGRIMRWRIGALGTDAAFAGRILERSSSTITAIEKVGAGIWTVSADNNYVGGTVVAEGTLLVNNSSGSGTGSGPVEVGSGATLGGTGAIGGEVTLQSGAALRPGQSVGTLTIGENLYLNSGSLLNFELGAAGDRVDVGGDLSLAGTLNVTDAGGLGAGTYTLMTYGGELSMGGVTLGTMPPPYLGSIDTGTPGQVNLVVTTTNGPPTGFDEYAAKISDPALRGLQDDPDGDGCANLLEYVTGADPTNVDSAADMDADSAGGILLLMFARDTNAVDATLVVEGSDSVSDGAAWRGIATNAAGSWGGATNVLETGVGSPVDVRIRDDHAGATNRFLRLRVTRP
jgi:autotransporter-associated beta strand protein